MTAHRTGTREECPESADVAALGVADWLGFAAAPTFAIMALLTAVLGGGHSTAEGDCAISGVAG